MFAEGHNNNNKHALKKFFVYFWFEFFVIRACCRNSSCCWIFMIAPRGCCKRRRCMHLVGDRYVCMCHALLIDICNIGGRALSHTHAHSHAWTDARTHLTTAHSSHNATARQTYYRHNWWHWWMSQWLHSLCNGAIADAVFTVCGHIKNIGRCVCVCARKIHSVVWSCNLNGEWKYLNIKFKFTYELISFSY